VALFERDAASSAALPGDSAEDTIRTFIPVHTHGQYLELLAEALRLWRELEAETGTPLLTQTGFLRHGAAGSVDALARVLPRYGFSAEVLDTAEAEARWPGMRFDACVLLVHEGAQMRAAAAVQALQDAARARGASIRHRARVARIRILGDERAQLEIEPLGEDGEPDGAVQVVECRRLIVALGPWTSRLLGSSIVLPRLAVTREQPITLALSPAVSVVPPFEHVPEAGDLRYRTWPASLVGAPQPGARVTLHWDGGGRPADPDKPTSRTDRLQLSAAKQYVREWLPGGDLRGLVESSCVYTSTKDAHFVVDRAGPVAVAAGFSGRGFTFAPAVGGLLAGLAEDTHAPAIFSLKAPRESAHPAWR
jgi:sarcosine oxidase